jgi:hypothetical protein
VLEDTQAEEKKFNSPRGTGKLPEWSQEVGEAARTLGTVVDLEALWDEDRVGYYGGQSFSP